MLAVQASCVEHLDSLTTELITLKIHKEQVPFTQNLLTNTQ
jgi:hypothetical protein